MTKSSDDILNTWGRKFLGAKGYDVPDNEPVVVELSVNGGCDCCGDSVDGVMDITYGEGVKTLNVMVNDWDFRETLLDLIKFSVESGDIL